MNPLATMLALLHLKRRTRVCAKCGHRQDVPEAQARVSVTCRRCGAVLPPQPANRAPRR